FKMADHTCTSEIFKKIRKFCAKSLETFFENVFSVFPSAMTSLFKRVDWRKFFFGGTFLQLLKQLFAIVAPNNYFLSYTYNDKNSYICKLCLFLGKFFK